VAGLEERIPEAVANAPGSDKPSRRTGTFEGYTIVGSLKTGGSGGKLYVAEPDEKKAASFARSGIEDVGQVVIKSFSLRDGSSMAQIVRESRALEAARKLGLILEHYMAEEHFYYVMRYVPGEDLTTVTKRLHSPTGNLGLTTDSLQEAMKYITDLLESLDHFHQGGLWHKDVKPDNIIVHDSKAHLVDFGLITPLHSGMTLTTHGTEYFRDPELVRMALRGAKVHEVDGVKFDIYGSGAVLFAVIENSFPAHGGLSQITKRCPESLRWIVRRAMTDLNQRYPNASAMLADLRTVQNAADPFKVRPADLPSMKGEPVDGFLGHDEPDEFADMRTPTPAQGEAVAVAHAASPVPPRGAAVATEAPASSTKRGTPRIRVTDWLTGKYAWDPNDPSKRPSPPVSPGSPGSVGAPRQGFAPHAIPVAHTPHQAKAKLVPAELRAPASEQLANARARAQAARDRAQARRSPSKHRGRHDRRNGRYSNEPNAGVVVAVLFFLVGAAVLVGGEIGRAHV